MSVYTTLEDSENNIEINIDEKGNCSVSDVVKSIEFRIKKHREFIKRDREKDINLRTKMTKQNQNNKNSTRYALFTFLLSLIIKHVYIHLLICFAFFHNVNI